MPQTLLCALGVVVYVATLCVTLSYGYLALGRAYEADAMSTQDRDRFAAHAGPAGSVEAFAAASSAARFRSVGVVLIHLGDPDQDLLEPSPFPLVEDRPERDCA
jgi:hypothetical protein